MALTEIEDQLISSDLGVNASIKIVDKLRNHKFELTSKNKEISKEMILNVVKDELNKIGKFDIEINFHSEVNAKISLKIDKIKSK